MLPTKFILVQQEEDPRIGYVPFRNPPQTFTKHTRIASAFDPCSSLINKCQNQFSLINKADFSL
ncbi:hypothetical protein K469DRAFT_706331 [Zopfia rhizophila CBS 207.26]|uniref:Uncharacterized protein n=1 Tax=Zopfia rhizophila CBS 207.26 TaxID=1314779 RepID=A0A6A6D4I7_9PEZI|nr:hypothetical protein K469DRAFT_717668 [Zopfia rhizophila CBS 207.26]KAF2194851.1 hypothetical protein K469DRAFT_706331 [Zopfia rhizophila CBS 207.26]